MVKRLAEPLELATGIDLDGELSLVRGLGVVVVVVVLVVVKPNPLAR